VTSVCESCADWWEKVKEKKREEGKQTCWFFFWKSPLSTNTLTLSGGNASTVQYCSG
jgi:hypothetical protein